MGDAEIIPITGRGPGRARSARSGRGPAVEPEPLADVGSLEADPPEADDLPLMDEAPVGDPPPPEPADPPPPDPSPPTPPAADPADQPPVQTLESLLREIGQVAGAVWTELAPAVRRARKAAADPWSGLGSLAQLLGFAGPQSGEQLVDFFRSRLTGDYQIDEFGFDADFTTQVFLPLLRPLAQSWFRVEVRGAENLPDTGAALLVANHAGAMPLDGMILHTVVYDEIARHVRMLGADLIFTTPYSHDLARKTGTTLACQEDAERLLAADQLVAVFPEGFKGLGKPFSDRYKLQRFGRGGFVSAAVRAQVPIIPVSIVGSEEIYPLIASAPTAARALGVPYFPITPLFPWLGLLGLIPLPSKWIIEFGEAIATDELPTGAADDPMVVFDVTDQVRETIQQTLYSLLTQRRSTFV